MSADRTIICRNKYGVEVRFSYDEDAPLFLEGIDGVMKVTNKVTTSENTREYETETRNTEDGPGTGKGSLRAWRDGRRQIQSP